MTLFLKHDLDILIQVCYGPGQSKRNEMQRRFAPASKEDACLVLPFGGFVPASSAPMRRFTPSAQHRIDGLHEEYRHLPPDLLAFTASSDDFNALVMRFTVPILMVTAAYALAQDTKQPLLRASYRKTGPYAIGP